MAQPDIVVRYEFNRNYSADLRNRIVLKNGIPLKPHLTSLEFDVLEFFLEHPNQVIERGSVKPLRSQFAGRNQTDDYISRIGKKLGIRKGELFVTHRKIGYALDANVNVVYASDEQKGDDVFKASELNFNTHTVDSMRTSLKQSLEALRISRRRIPRARVTVAFDYINLSMAAYSAELPARVMGKARWQARMAFRANPKLSEALGVLGLISMIYDYDWDKARDQLERALDLNSNDSATLLSYAHYLIGTGRLREAVKAVEKASRIDPTDLIINASVGWIHLLAGDTKAAIKRGRHSIFLYPDFPPGHVILGWAYEASGDFGKAREHYQSSLEKEYSPAALASLGHLEGITGNRAKARASLKKLDELFERGMISYIPAYCRALVLVGLGDINGSLAALDDAFRQRCDWLIHLAVDRRWHPLRGTGGFQKLLKRVGVVENSRLQSTRTRSDNP